MTGSSSNAAGAGQSAESWFDALEHRLHAAVQEFRSPAADLTPDRMRGLYISEAEVDELLAAPVSAHIQRIGQVSANLTRLLHAFGLDRLEQQAFLICLAPELDLRYERLYGYLQDDMTRRRPTVDLVLRLMDSDCAETRRALSPWGRLARCGLLADSETDGADLVSFLSTTLRINARVTEYLLGIDTLDRRIENWATLQEPDPGACVAADERPRETDWLVRHFSSPGDWLGPGPIVYVYGDSSCALRLAQNWACATRTRLLVIDFANWRAALGGGITADNLLALTREAMLHDAVLVLRGAAPVGEHDGDGHRELAVMLRVLEEYPKLTFLIGSTRWEPARYWTDRQTLTIEVEAPSAATRAMLWSAHLDDRFPDNAAQELGTRYQLSEDADMRAVVKGALGRASLKEHPRVSLADLLDTARTVASPELGGLAQRLEARHTWDDIVLPADGTSRMRELCARFRHRATVYERWGYGESVVRRRGVAALFVGLPGTGKTMAAEIVAAELAYDLYRVDLSAIVSKYIGETEKNLEAIFHAAEQGEVVLLFDEADALFGKRSEVRDAHDRYANIEVAYLLQRLETYSGVAILTSNLSGNLDEAFLRRLDVVVEFPFPQEAERCEIWRRSLPAGAPRADDVDPLELARGFKLTGGHIRNSALAAAFLAADDGEPISRKHLLHAIRREYEKVGKLVS